MSGLRTFLSRWSRGIGLVSRFLSQLGAAAKKSFFE
jgi:hypothetical protein